MPAAPARVSNSDDRTRPIGVFDSGVGGLTVLHELLVTLPEEDFLYLGDSKRFPFGTRDRQDLTTIATEIAQELVDRGAKLLVVACNSATAAALPALRERFEDRDPGIDVIGVIQPESQAAVVATHNGRIGVLATPTTIASGAYEQALQQADPHLKVENVPCPDLAPIIQAGFPFDENVIDTVRRYTEPLKAAGTDTVILGCTHYPLVRPLLQRMLGRGVTLISPGHAIARRVECALEAKDRATTNTREGSYRFLCTGDPEEFRHLGTRFLQMPLGDVEHVTLRSSPREATAV